MEYRIPSKKDELKGLIRLYHTKNVKFPVKVFVKMSGSYLFSEQIFQNYREIYSAILEKRKRKEHIYRCFFCNKFKKEGFGGRFMPMDKREYGDNDFGFTFACYKCIPKEYGRL